MRNSVEERQSQQPIEQTTHPQTEPLPKINKKKQLFSHLKILKPNIWTVITTIIALILVSYLKSFEYTFFWGFIILPIQIIHALFPMQVIYQSIIGFLIFLTLYIVVNLLFF